MKKIPKSVSEIRMQDPLMAVTRKVRRNLLISSFIGLIIVTTGLVPTKINSLGIELSTDQRDWFSIMTSLLIFYFLITFIIYAASDFIAWRISFNRTRLEFILDQEESKNIHTNRNELSNTYKNLWKLTRFSLPISSFRVFIEFVFPILFGLYSSTKILLDLFPYADLVFFYNVFYLSTPVGGLNF